MEAYRDIGLIILRLGIGASMLIFHGYGKITGGTAVWEKLGASMSIIGIDFLPVFWGFMAAFAESVCSALIMLGILFRPSSLLLACTMFIAVVKHLTMLPGTLGAGWSGASHAIELFAVYTGLFFLGPGRFVVTIKK
jgi:putative oxidoreductase